MSKDSFIRARVETSLKEETENILNQLGLSVSDAITLFYKQITLHNGLPFEVRLPNAATIIAMKDTTESNNLNNYKDVKELADKFAKE